MEIMQERLADSDSKKGQVAAVECQHLPLD